MVNAVTAEVEVLFEGYVHHEDGRSRVGSTVGFVRDAEALVVVDPGLVPHQRRILDPLERLGVRAEDVTDVVLSHHHPDHTLNAGLFPQARVHDHWGTYQGDLWIDREAEGFEVSPSITLIETPGHTPQDVSTLVVTAAGLVVFTHLWWFEAGPPEDPNATDRPALHRGRERVLSLQPARVVPGHGPAFAPGPRTPR